MAFTAQELEKIRQAVRTMNNNGNNEPLFYVLKEELTARGWWKNRPRRIPGPNEFKDRAKRPRDNS